MRLRIAWRKANHATACYQMKKKLIVILALSWLVIVFLGIIMWFATPHIWPLNAGSIKAKNVMIEDKPFIRIDGEGMNYLGQFQLVNLDLNDSDKQITVTRCIIFRNPFTKITVSDGWPVFYPLEGVKSGKYSVVYESSEGKQTAGTFQVP